MLNHILCIETANAVTSVALAQNGIPLSSKHILEPNKAADYLPLLIQELLKDTSLEFKDLNAIAISAGPGSYTGLRIAAAAAKGYCYTLKIPLIAISTLEAMVIGAIHRYQLTHYDYYFPMIDARRMEVFTGIYNNQNKIVKPFISLIIDSEFEQLLDKDKKYCFFGNGASKLKSINIPEQAINTHFTPNAEDLCALAQDHYLHQHFVDIAYFEPNYHKEFYFNK